MPLPQILELAPDWTSPALLPNKEFGDVTLSSFRGKWVVFFWYPFDFTFVCPTEIIAFADRADEFAAINTQVIGASCDSLFSHLAWVNTPRSEGGLGEMKIPLLADFTKKVATEYGVLIPARGGGAESAPFRALFLIDPTGTLRQITVNDTPVGRNVDEVIRLLKAFQFTDVHGEVCPANWQPGDLTMSADPEKSKVYFNAVHSSSTGSAAASTIEEVVDSERFASIVSAPGLTVVDFWAPWCRNCKKIAPTVNRLAAELTNVKFITVNTTEAEAIAAEKGVEGLPTFQFYVAGELKGEFKGTKAPELEAAIRSFV